jgi:hypothetical protein
MPFFSDYDVLTRGQLTRFGGRAAVQRELLEGLWNGEAARLLDGHKYVIQIATPRPTNVGVDEGYLCVSVMIRWWHAEPGHAEMEEIVYGSILRPDFAGTDANGIPIVPNEASIATVGNRRFQPHPEGWQRIQ